MTTFHCQIRKFTEKCYIASRIHLIVFNAFNDLWYCWARLLKTTLTTRNAKSTQWIQIKIVCLFFLRRGCMRNDQRRRGRSPGAACGLTRPSWTRPLAHTQLTYAIRFGQTFDWGRKKSSLKVALGQRKRRNIGRGKS